MKQNNYRTHQIVQWHCFQRDSPQRWIQMLEPDQVKMRLISTPCFFPQFHSSTSNDIKAENYS